LHEKSEQEDAGAVVPPKQGKQCNNGDQAAKNIDPVIKGDRRQAAEQDRQQDISRNYGFISGFKTYYIFSHSDRL